MWESLLELRTQVLKQLEVLRTDKKIGKSVDAVVYLGFETPEELIEALYTVGGLNKVAELFGVSAVFMSVTNEYKLQVAVAEGNRCQRCLRFDNPDTHLYWPEDLLCQRCVWALLEILDKYPPYRIVEGNRFYITEHQALSRL